jgi:Flp pilus assembly pilin Flp
MTRTRIAGQSLVEYLLIVALVSMALFAGSRSPLQMLLDAAAERYERFALEASRP